MHASPHHRPRPARAWQLPSGLFGALLVGWCSVSCRNEAPRDAGTSGAPCVTTTALSEDEWAPPARFTPPESQLRLWASFSESWLNDELDRRQPRELTRDERSVGAPGRASYVVRRGEVHLGQEHGRITLSLPISADISVCKPLGRGCLRYGQCSPQFVVEASLDNALLSDLEWPPPDLTLTTTRKCIIGLDVTPQLERVARGQLGSVRRELRAAWPNPREWAERGAEALAEPVLLPDGQCVGWELTTMRQRPLEVTEVRERDDHSNRVKRVPQLEGGVELGGKIVTLPDCRAATPAPLPPLELEPGLDRHSLLWLPERLSWDAMESEARERLDEDPEVSLLEIRPGRDGLGVLVAVTGRDCGQLWVGGPLVEKDGMVVLSTLSLLGDSGGQTRRATEMLERLSERLLARLRWALPRASWARSDRLDPWLDDQLHEMQTELGAWQGRLHWSNRKVGEIELRPTAGGLVALIPMTGDLRLERDPQRERSTRRR